GLVGVLPFAATTADVHFGDVSMAWWLPVLGLGVVTPALAYVTVIAATRRLGSRLASFVALTEVLAALGFAWVLLGQAPRSIQLLGAALVLLGVVIVKSGGRSAPPRQLAREEIVIHMARCAPEGACTGPPAREAAVTSPIAVLLKSDDPALRAAWARRLPDGVVEAVDGQSTVTLLDGPEHVQELRCAR